MTLAGVLVAVLAAVFSLVQARAASNQADAAQRSATAAEEQVEAARAQAEESRRANDLAEQALQDSREEVQRQREEARRQHEAAAVRWRVDGHTENGCYVRNIGHATAYGVVVKAVETEQDWLAEADGEVAGVEVPPNATVPFHFNLSLASPSPPTTLWVRWDGAPRPVAVPVY
jgi:hypothetical protein